MLRFSGELDGLLPPTPMGVLSGVSPFVLPASEGAVECTAEGGPEAPLLPKMLSADVML